MYKFLRFDYSAEKINSGGDDIRAGKHVKSKSPGNKDLSGKVISVSNDNAIAQFEGGKKQSVPINHLSLEKLMA